MSSALDRSDVDPSVTDEEIEQAIDGTPAEFPTVDEQDQPPAELITLSSPVAASIPQRIANAKALRNNHTFVGVGMCLATVRGPILQIPGLYPTAEIAGEHSKPFHSDGTAPRGSIGFGFNGRDGHVWLELGEITLDGKKDALVSTTDFHEPGYEGVALRSRMLSWCGATSWGWGESVNGVDVWPDAPTPPDHAFHAWQWEERVAFLREEARREDRAGHPVRARQLRTWANRIKSHHSRA